MTSWYVLIAWSFQSNQLLIEGTGMGLWEKKFYRRLSIMFINGHLEKKKKSISKEI